jgi:dTDP-L-rhamnose 4-epimerase
MWREMAGAIETKGRVAVGIQQQRQSGTCLVTGGAGFIGCAIAPGLSEVFDRVVVLDNLHPQIHASGERPSALDARAELVVSDVTSAAAWDALLTDVRPDVIVHLAAETGTGQSLTESNRHAAVNVGGTSQMLDALARAQVRPRRLVLTSSRAVYGEGAWRSLGDGNVFYPGRRSAEMLRAAQWDFPGAEPVPMDARTIHAEPASIYGATKLAQEHLITMWADAFDVEAVVLRLQNVYGPGQSLINPYTGIMSLFCRMAKAGAAIPLYEDGEVRRDFILIDDVAAAVLSAVVRPRTWRGILDIGSGEMQTIRTAAEIIARHYGAPSPQVTGQFRAGDVRHAFADISHASQALGWAPRYDLAAGLSRLASWIDDVSEG